MKTVKQLREAMDYHIGKQVLRHLETQMKTAGDAVRKITDAHPKGPMNLTPDHVRAMPEYKTARAAYEKASAAHKSHITAFRKQHGKQYDKETRAEIDAKRQAKLQNK